MARISTRAIGIGIRGSPIWEFGIGDCGTLIRQPGGRPGAGSLRSALHPATLPPPSLSRPTACHPCQGYVIPPQAGQLPPPNPASNAAHKPGYVTVRSPDHVTTSYACCCHAFLRCQTKRRGVPEIKSESQLCLPPQPLAH
jgi:hypothetical protein